MILRLRKVFEVTGERVEINCTVDPNEAAFDAQWDFLAPIKISGCVENRAGVVVLKLECEFSIKHECDRCLTEFERDYHPEFEHTLVTRTYSDDDELVVCENFELDLDELVIGDILLSIPTKILCREDCKGLCPVCGKDLNEGECQHNG